MIDWQKSKNKTPHKFRIIAVDGMSHLARPINQPMACNLVEKKPRKCMNLIDSMPLYSFAHQHVQWSPWIQRIKLYKSKVIEPLWWKTQKFPETQMARKHASSWLSQFIPFSRPIWLLADGPSLIKNAVIVFFHYKLLSNSLKNIVRPKRFIHSLQNRKLIMLL